MPVYPQGSLVPWHQFCADVDAEQAPKRALETCDIRPWLQEIANRVEEARVSGTNVVNLGYTHPRGFFPNQILRRPKVRELMKQCADAGWQFNTEKFAPVPTPASYFNPKTPNQPVGFIDPEVEFASLEPYLAEIKRRSQDADQHFYYLDTGEYGTKKVFLGSVDLTCHHPRGGIPPIIMKRIERRKDPDWLKKAREEIDRLYGEANKAESFAKTQEERADSVDNPANLKAAAKELKERAAGFRWQAQWLKKEIGDAAAA